MTRPRTTLRENRRRRKKQLRINTQLKKRLYRDVFMAPCCYCAKIFLMNDLTIEHIIPRSHGGTNDEKNIALACAPCNQERGREAWFTKKEQTKQKYQQIK